MFHHQSDMFKIFQTPRALPLILETSDIMKDVTLSDNFDLTILFLETCCQISLFTESLSG